MSKKVPENKKSPIQLEGEEDEPIEGDDHLEHAEGEEVEEGEQNDEEEKMAVEIKPRENFLKEKLENLGVEKNNPKIFTGIDKSLSEAMKKFQSDILSNQLLITEVQKDLSKLIPKQGVKKYSNAKKFSSAQRLHLLNTLKKDENKIKMAITKLNDHEKLLENESYAGMDDESKIVEMNIRNDTLKKIKRDKQILNERIVEIEFIASDILTDEKNMDFRANHNKKMKNFFNNFEEDTKKIQVKVRKYGEGSSERIERLKTEMDNLMEKKQKEIEEKEKEEKDKREEKINKLREHEREIITKRIEENNEKRNQLKNLEETPIEAPLHKEKEKKYKEKEEKYLRTELAKRKDIMKSVTKEEINEFSSKVKEKFNEAKVATEEKKKILFSSWKENKKNLPEYVFTVPEAEEGSEEKRKESFQANFQAKKEFCENNIPKPTFDERKRIELEKLNEKKPTEKLHYNRSKRIILKKSTSSDKNKKYPWELKLDYVDKETDEKQKLMIQKKKPFYASTSLNKKPVIPLEKPIDYLQEIKKKNEEKKTNLAYSVEIPENKWEKKLKNKNNSIAQNVEQITNEVKILDNKVEEEEKFLKLNGGIENNPEVGQKVSTMMIDSIKAKLSLISLSKETQQNKRNKIREKLEKSKNINKSEIDASQSSYLKYQSQINNSNSNLYSNDYGNNYGNTSMGNSGEITKSNPRYDAMKSYGGLSGVGTGQKLSQNMTDEI
ncbi:MAG: hypothetical protein MJ252_19815 [archaeon]|nr:hypothetical protein [archaeon]